MNDAEQKQYQEALKQIDDLSPFVGLVDRIKSLADKGAVNDIRRLLVTEFVKMSQPTHPVDKAHIHKLPYIPRELRLNEGKGKMVTAICAECGQEFIHTTPPIEIARNNLDAPPAPLVDGELFTDNFYQWLQANGVELDDQFDDGEWRANIDINKLKLGITAHLQAAVLEARLDEHNKVLQAYAEMIEKRVIKDDEPYNTSPKSLKSPLIKLRYRNDLRKQQRQALKEVTEQHLNQGADHE